MKVFVNEQAFELAGHCNIEQLLQYLEKPLKGSAVALNQTVVSRCKWAELMLNEGDHISLFQAIAGG